jgi:hypothetical protein
MTVLLTELNTSVLQQKYKFVCDIKLAVLNLHLTAYHLDPTR